MSEEDSRILPTLGVEEVEPDICEDTYENRITMMEANVRWRQVTDEDGRPLQLLQVFSASVHNDGLYEMYKDILVDPSDPWSDYVDPREIPLDHDGIQYWVFRLVQKHHIYSEEVRLNRRNPGSREPVLPTRCKATKADGMRCWGWACDRAQRDYCRKHAPGQAIKNDRGYSLMVAKAKLIQAAPKMAENLLHMAEFAESEQVKMKAMTEALDRAGLTTSQDIKLSADINVNQDPAAIVRERLSTLAKRIQASQVSAEEHELESVTAGTNTKNEIVEAEIVE